ncbi:hypothetical protein O2N63_17025 [Aliiroseovarius sp. KMU-50]|uniref:DUF2946 domain-containing protein n=1 Tax=Aliiroseovarius salicola TaxID=3009082 RepID=A0ABT4W5M8_9RHOB|nr:hypothetical protein [Aliiroseovarius sp. KMU-50]MDA5095796.1 hypothetical protein [Aliiroseovarius sp. KMU-50]
MSEINAQSLDYDVFMFSKEKSVRFKVWAYALINVAQVVWRSRTVFVVALVALLTVSSISAHAGHGLGFANAQIGATQEGPGDAERVEADIMFDCTIHPSCHALTLSGPAEQLAVLSASGVLPEIATYLPGILGPPLPYPPN